MTTVPLDRSPERRAAALAGLLGPVSTLDLYEIAAAVLTELDHRGEGVLPTNLGGPDGGLVGRTGYLGWDDADQRWHSVLYAPADPDEGNTVPATLELMVGITATSTTVNALRMRVAR